MFQHTAARRRLTHFEFFHFDVLRFQHTAARRRLTAHHINRRLDQPFQHTAARRRLMGSYIVGGASGGVSTHSRPKAAETYIDETGGFMIVSTHSRPKAAD